MTADDAEPWGQQVYVPPAGPPGPHMSYVTTAGLHYVIGEGMQPDSLSAYDRYLLRAIAQFVVDRLGDPQRPAAR